MIVSQSRQMKYSGTDSYPRAEDKGTTAERERERERAISASRKLQSGQDALCANEDDAILGLLTARKNNQRKVTGAQIRHKAMLRCWDCGRRHDLQRQESCRAYGKSRNKYHKPNHFAVKCHSKKPPAVHPVTGSEDPDEDEKIQMSIAITLDDTQLVTLRLESCSLIRFQVDTGAQCNVVP